MPSSTDQDRGIGEHGSCCAEVDVWQGNSVSSTLALHPCDTPTFTQCSGDACGGDFSQNRYAGSCDPDGCDFNPFRLGATGFYGSGTGSTVNSKQKVTVVTQFVGSGSQLSEVKRVYVQNGQVIPNPSPQTSGITGNSITAAWCEAENKAFNSSVNSFSDHGGMQSIGKAMSQGMVLVMSVQAEETDALWLDGDFPAGTDTSLPGVARGTCVSNAATLPTVGPTPAVTFSNIKFGPIGSTFATT
jgi:cellulose 1,4-beta-cellobiosidase